MPLAQVGLLDGRIVTWIHVQQPQRVAIFEMPA
jgi:hypothetical protein